MQSKIIILIAGVLLAAVGCNKQEEFDSETAGKGSVSLEIAEVNPAGLLTKAVVDGETFPQDGHIGLFLFADAAASQTYGDGYANVDYSYNSQKGKWTASPSIKVGGTPGYLYGYYPYKAGTQQQPVNIKAIQVASSFNGDDVMYATPQDPITDQTAGNVSVTMKHALARVSITIVNKGYTGDAKLQSIKFAGAEIAESGTLNAVDGTITATKAQAVTLTVPEASQAIATGSGSIYECLLVPSAVKADRQNLALTLKIDGQEKSANLTGDNGVIFGSGVKSRIVINLSNSGISVAGLSIDDWQTVNVGKYKVTVKVADDVTSGDIMYAPYIDGDKVIINAYSKSNQNLKCALPGGKFCPKSKTDNLVYTFTLSDIESDITATIGYAMYLTVKAQSNDASLGTASFEGECYEGETITFTATEIHGMFVEWQDVEGKKISTDNPYYVTLTSNLTVKAVFEFYDVLPGVFTVKKDSEGNPTKTVHFSMGNLYWDGSKYGFESKQYEFKDSWDTTHVSHFYWSSTASVAYAEEYNDPGKKEGDVFFTNKEDILVGIAPAGTYKSLSADEWICLINERNASTIGETTNARYAKATIKVDDSKSVPGMILFPDVFALPEGVTSPTGINTDNAGFDTNTYSVDDWSKLESVGAVFLPAAGYRKNKVINKVGEGCYSWSSSCSIYGNNPPVADCLIFNIDKVTPKYNNARFNGSCVRLVAELK